MLGWGIGIGITAWARRGQPARERKGVGEQGQRACSAANSAPAELSRWKSQAR